MSDRERAKIKISLVSKGARSSLEGFVTPEQCGQIVATVNGQAAQATPAEPVAEIVGVQRANGHLFLTVKTEYALAIGMKLYTTPPAVEPDFPDWLYKMYDVIPYISRNKQSGVKLVFISDDMADNFLKWLAAKDDEFVKWSAK